MKAVGYIRVSTTEQAKEGISLDNQLYKINAYASVKDLDLVSVIRDEGKSGKNLNRPGITELLQLIQKKEVDAVIVYKLDRLTRRTKDLLYLAEDVFAKHGITFHSLNENIDTTSATGKFFLTIMGAMAQMERDLISERTHDALQELKRQQRRLGSPDMVPFGYSMSSRSKATIQNLTKNADFHKLLLMRDMRYKKKMSLSLIGREFSMAKSSVKYILENPVYKELLG